MESQAPPPLAQNLASNTDEQSCKEFVQGFYDWYWNQMSDKARDLNFDSRKLHDDRDVLRRRPPVLNSNLIRLIKRDHAQSKALGGGYANLDFDPFLNSQDPDGKYDVVQVTMIGNQCRATLSERDITTEAERTSKGWVFSNFYYSFYSDDRSKKELPDDDLVQILNQPLEDDPQPIKGKGRTSP